jgi:hypothetical protein
VIGISSNARASLEHRLISKITRCYRQHENPEARKFIIIDACFAGAAQPDFIPQGPVAERMEEQTMAGFAESGTALLCAASAVDVALAPVFETYTMFSDALLNVMQSGSPTVRRKEARSSEGGFDA